MRYLTIAGFGRFLLLDDLPQWPVESRHRVPAEAEIALNARERRAVRSWIRSRIDQAWTCTLHGDGFAAAREALQVYQNESLLVPFWGLLIPKESVPAVIVARRWLVISAGGETSVVDSPGSVIADPAALFVVPLFEGRWSEEPRVSLHSTAFAEYHFAAQDNGVSVVFDPGTYADGPPAGDGEPRPILPAWPNFANAQQSGTASLPVMWEEHLPSLTSQSAFYPKQAGRLFAFSFSVTESGSAVLWLGFWAGRRGPTDTFWLPSFAHDGDGLLADAPAGSLTIEADIRAVGGIVNRCVALFSAPTLELARVASVSGTTITLEAPLSRGWARQDTLCGLAALSRFAAAELALSWIQPGWLQCAATFRETPAEYATAPGELSGTQGSVGVVITLFRFERWTAAGLQETRTYTDAAELSVVGSDPTLWFPAPFEAGAVTQSLDLEDDTLTVRCRGFAGNPLQDLMAQDGSTDFIWRIELSESVNEAEPVVRFFGELVSVEADGPWFEGRAVRLGGLPERKAPSALVQTTCNYAVYSRACGLVASAWGFVGNVLVNNGTTVTVSPPAAPPGFVGSMFDGFFAGGVISQGTIRTRIVADTLGAGGVRTLTIERVLPLVTVAATLFPGCDGAHTTCRAYNASTNPSGRFNNFQRFGGFPWLPIANPTLAAVRNPAPAAGKK